MTTTPANITILVADDDVNIAQLISMECEEEGFNVESVHDGQQALLQLRQKEFQLAILDWDMPLMSGYDVCQRLRDTGNTIPILMVTAKDEVEDRVKALDAGADDYLCKPFNIRELLARVRALVRRNSNTSNKKALLEYGALSINRPEHICSVNGKAIHLTVREFDLLSTLMEQPKQVISREQLLTEVWGEDYFGDITVVDTYIKYLRVKLRTHGLGEMIQTIRGVGFTLRESA